MVKLLTLVKMCLFAKTFSNVLSSGKPVFTSWQFLRAKKAILNFQHVVFIIVHFNY